MTGALLTGIVAMAQTQTTEEVKGKVGINTDKPQATLEIQPNVANADANATTNEGLLIPRLSKARVAKMAAPVESTLVYVTDEVAEADNANFTGTGKGFYYYDGTTKKWVKQSGQAGQSWQEGTAGGSEMVFLKPANDLGDVVGYRKDRNILFNLGGVTREDSSWQQVDSPFGSDFGASNFQFLSSSDALPINSTIGFSRDNYFKFNDFLSVIKEDHIAKLKGGLNVIYTGTESRVTTKGVTSKIESITAHGSSATHYSNSPLRMLMGGSSLSIGGSLDGIYNPTIDRMVAHQFRTRNAGTATDMIAIEAIVNNYGTASNLNGIVIDTRSQQPRSQQPVNNAVPAHTIKSIKGLTSYTTIAANATVETDGVFGIDNSIAANQFSTVRRLIGAQNQVTVNENVNIVPDEGVKVYSNINRVTNRTSAPSTDFHISRSEYTFHNTSEARDVMINSSIATGFDITNGKKINRNLFYYRNLANNPQTWSADTVTGLNLRDITNGQTSNYGIYLEDVGNSTATKNFAIYTKKGKIHFGDNVGVGVEAPTEKLEVAGAIKVANTNSACSATNEGAIRYTATNTDNGAFQGCKKTNGAFNWVTLTP